MGLNGVLLHCTANSFLLYLRSEIHKFTVTKRALAVFQAQLQPYNLLVYIFPTSLWLVSL